MTSKLSTLAVALFALLLAACPSESDPATPADGGGATPSAEAGQADEIDQAAKEAAAKIDEENADAELEKLKQELGEDE
jgi:hypothetical protein